MPLVGNDRRLNAAEVKNRAEQVKYELKLAQLEREKRRDLRQTDIQFQKFKSKYFKPSNQPSEVTMYQTHYPGFCYTRSGEQRNWPKCETTKCFHFEHIHSLIFTEDEVDLEKIICLHLLSAHRAENLTPPKKRIKYTCREHSPYERLIERSKKGFANYERLSKLLPLYTIELVDHGAAPTEKPEPPINDGRLASRILINEKVMALINTVVTTLEKSSAEKFQQLVIMANSPSKMREMLETVRMAEFMDFLFNHQLLNSCESFVLTPPFKIKIQDLDVKTKQGSLENFVNNLRHNVLQRLSKPIAKPQKEEEEVKRELLQTSLILMPKSKMEKKKSSGVSLLSSKTSRKVDSKKTRKSLEEERPLVRYKEIDFIARNKEAAGKTKRIEYDVDEDEFDFLPRKRSSASSSRNKMKILEPVNTLKNIPPPVVEEREYEIEDKFLGSMENDTSNEVESEIPGNDDRPNAKKARRPIWERTETRNHIRHTTCPACMERWKKPLPTPKTPRVKKSELLPDIYTDSLKTNSHHRLSMMINKAMYKLESYDRRYSSENENFRRTSVKKEEENDTTDNIYLNPMDLAKIELEIRQREANKKVENFLEKYSKDKY